MANWGSGPEPNTFIRNNGVAGQLDRLIEAPFRFMICLLEYLFVGAAFHFKRDWISLCKYLQNEMHTRAGVRSLKKKKKKIVAMRQERDLMSSPGHRRPPGLPHRGGVPAHRGAGRTRRSGPGRRRCCYTS